MGDKSGESRGDTRPGGCRIALRVVPGSRRDAIVGWLGERLKVKVAAPPQDGRANQGVIRLLARALGVNEKSVTIISGEHAPEKVVEIAGVDPAWARQRLEGEMSQG